ncbi:MAG: sporulation protein [Paenibacillaceae bacterium]|nr:sporulation protein [Paenibacillaceae bacterium]
MQHGWLHTRSRPFTLLLGLLAVGFVVSIITYPEQAFQASLRGLRLWWDWVFPALMPFLILTEMMMGLGIVHGLGILLEPLMRRVFRLPGAGGWVFAVGVIGGYPLGADACAKLRMREDIGREDAERLAAVSHLCNPMMMIGVVGTGFLHSPEAGLLLAVFHYAAAIAAGFLFRLPRRGTTEALPGRKERLAPRVLRAMDHARARDGRAFGKLLGDAVTQTIQNLMMVGGLIMIFSVAIQLTGLLLGASTAAKWALSLLPGVLEPHLGSYAASRLTGWTAAVQAAVIGGCLAWSGLSLHAQVLGFTRTADIRYGPFLRFRLVHGAIAVILTLLLWEPLGKLVKGAETVFSPAGPLGLGTPRVGYTEGWSFRELAVIWKTSFTLMALLLASMLLVSLLIRLMERAIKSQSRR